MRKPNSQNSERTTPTNPEFGKRIGPANLPVPNHQAYDNDTRPSSFSQNGKRWGEAANIGIVAQILPGHVHSEAEGARGFSSSGIKPPRRRVPAAMLFPPYVRVRHAVEMCRILSFSTAASGSQRHPGLSANGGEEDEAETEQESKRISIGGCGRSFTGGARVAGCSGCRRCHTNPSSIGLPHLLLLLPDPVNLAGWRRQKENLSFDAWLR